MPKAHFSQPPPRLPFAQLDEAEIKALEKRPCGPPMNLDIPLTLYALRPDYLYKLSGIFDDKRQKDRLRSMLATRQVTHDRLVPTENAKHPHVRAYWGATLQGAVPDESWYRAELAHKVLAIYDALNRRKRAKFTRMITNTPQIRAKPRKWLLAALFASVAVFLVAQSSFFPDIPRLLRTEGIGPTRQALAEAPEPRTQEERFYEAWADYRNGDYDDAVRKTHTLLGETSALSLEANCYYLLAHVQVENNQYLEALGSSIQAYQLYRKTGTAFNLFHCTLIMAKAYVVLEYFEDAEKVLETAFTIFKEQETNELHLGEFHAINYLLNLHLGNYPLSLEHALKAVQILEDSGDLDGLGNAYSNLGFSYLLNGELSKGLAFTARAQDMYFSQQDERKHIYNLINTVLLQKFLGDGHVDPYMLSRIRGWHRMEQNDDELIFQLDLALNHDSIP